MNVQQLFKSLGTKAGLWWCVKIPWGNKFAHMMMCVVHGSPVYGSLTTWFPMTFSIGLLLVKSKRMVFWSGHSLLSVGQKIETVKGRVTSEIAMSTDGQCGGAITRRRVCETAIAPPPPQFCPFPFEISHSEVVGTPA